MADKVLLTGSGGFIGRHLCDTMKSENISLVAPTSSDLNVIRKKDWQPYCGKHIKHVIHMAGKTFVPDSWANAYDFFSTNTFGTLNCLEFCRAEGISMTYVSAYVYGHPPTLPVHEVCIPHPNNPYAAAKYMGEELCRYYYDYFDVPISILRLFNVYGPGQNERFLISYILQEARSDGDSIVVKDLRPKRDFVYIDDVCRAILLSLKFTKGYHLFNVGSGQSYSVGEVIEIVQRALGTHKKVISLDETRRDDILDVCADITTIKAAWGWIPKFSLENGIKECAANA